jgi:chitinase
MTAVLSGRRGRWSLLVGGVVLAVALAAAFVTSSGPTAGAPWSPAPHEVAPYVDVTGALPADPGALVGPSGQGDAVLAFVLAGGGECTPSWGGTVPIDDPAVAGVVNGLRARGGALTLASGGAQGPYLETACPDAGALAAAYASALDVVGTNRLDVDVEGDIPEATVAAALADLQRTRGTEVTLTVQVEDQVTGITPEGMAIVRAAREAGLEPRVNVMLMNFTPEGSWLPAMTAALDVALGQVGALEPGSDPADVAGRFGATVMIGRNDMGMTTTLADAAAIRDHAETRGLGFLGFWSAARDNGACPGAPEARSDCSGVEQAPHAYTETLGGFRA